MVLEQTLEDRAQVGRGFQVAVLVEVSLLQARPVGDDAASLERAARKQRDRRGAVVGAFVAVDSRGAAELGDERHHGLVPGCAHVALDRRDGGVERAQQC